MMCVYCALAAMLLHARQLRPEVRVGDGWRSHDSLKSEHRSTVTMLGTKNA